MTWPLYLSAMALPPFLILILRLFSALLPPRPAQLFSFAAFCLTSLLLTWFAASCGVVASIALRCAGYGGLSQWAAGRVFKWTMWAATGVEFRVNESSRVEGGRRGGEEALRTRPAVFVGNHQSELDVLMLGSIFPQYCSVTAKKSLKWVPFLGWFMALSKTVFIDRANRTTARAAFDTAATTMRTSLQSVFIFPEGTRSYASTPSLLPFKKGAFHLAIQAQVPIVPIVVANYAHVCNFQQRRIAPGVIDVSVLPPIPTKGLGAQDAEMLMVRAREAMMAELVRLTHVSGKGEGEPLPRVSGVEEKRAGELRKRS
ncbi:hypothetical protein BDV95DRAFT_177186 [Massariosphaeria phaeospora]|uniref:1-acyl-sn-glycerol-3-phosphate acyltransferase n=1 Tax=Massariosphaeria phaeospora TaxID=100035 RepID=A0A7C8I4Y4_9PLEO|nr:hypothetical protein BDV95DRAFT_177186 [Massariosphaeria phaeospora]